MNSFTSFLGNEKEKDYFLSLDLFIDREYSSWTCYPPREDVFLAFEKTPLKKIKVVILGQDPYHGEGEANGLAFSVCDNAPLPPSLKNIFKEIYTDFGKPIKYPNGNLTYLAEQGVLLLNSILTVRKDSPLSHSKKGWETFTDNYLKVIDTLLQPIVFMLWGKGFAWQKEKFITNKNRLILKSTHPSPLGANKKCKKEQTGTNSFVLGSFIGSAPFSKANDFLISKGEEPIRWLLD